MKKTIALLLAVAMLGGVLTGCGSSASVSSTSGSTAADSTSGTASSTAETDYSGETLVVQAWGGTYEETMRNYAIPMFEEMTGATVEVVSGGAPLSQLATEGDAASIDVLHVDCTEVVQGTEMGVLETLDFSKLENAADLYDEAFMYDNAVVTNWGTYGIIYRSDLVETAPTSWLDLWDEAYADGKVGVVDYSMGGGLEFAEAISRIQGTVISDVDNWDNLFAKMSALKPSIGVYASQHSDIESAITSGDIVISVETNGRAISLMKEGYDVAFCQPEEGAIAMTSLAAISSGSTHKDLAYIFLDCLLSPEVQKAYAENNYYAPSNAKTEVAEELQGYMPYGQEQVSKLLYMDSEKLEPVKADFIDLWNRNFK
ncbi:MAG: ABC transporter substrate-binding protein [Oscillospiraceae bacterium]